MSKSLGKYASPNDWLDALWHIRVERLSIANLLGDRKLERGELEFLETWSTHLNQEDRSLQLLESRLRYLLDTGDISSAEAEADRLVGMSKEAGKKAFIRRACGWRAVVYREQSRYSKAIADFETAEEFAENELQLMEIWLDKGMTLVYANRYEEAEKMLRGVVSIAQKYNDINSQGTAWNNLGICYGQQRKSFPAIEAYDRAIALYQQTGYKLGSAMASGNLSEIYLSRGQLDKALELSRQCQKLGEESEDVISIALGQDIEGRALAELEEFSAAAACFEKSFHTFRQVDDVVSQAMCGCHLVLCLINSGRIEAAGEFILRLEKLFSEEPGLDRDMLNTKAALLAAGGSPGQARQLLEEALADKKNRDRDMSPVLLHLGQLYSRQGDLHRAGEMMAIMQNLPGDQLTNLFKVKMHSAGWSLWSGCGEAEKAREQKNKGLALLEEMAGSYTDRGIWEKYCRKKEVRALLE